MKYFSELTSFSSQPKDDFITNSSVQNISEFSPSENVFYLCQIDQGANESQTHSYNCNQTGVIAHFIINMILLLLGLMLNLIKFKYLLLIRRKNPKTCIFLRRIQQVLSIIAVLMILSILLPELVSLIWIIQTKFEFNYYETLPEFLWSKSGETRNIWIRNSSAILQFWSTWMSIGLLTTLTVFTLIDYLLLSWGKITEKESLKETTDKKEFFIAVLFGINVFPTCFILAIFFSECLTKICEKTILDPVFLHVLVWPSETLRWIILIIKFVIPVFINLVCSTWSLILLNKFSTESKLLKTNREDERIRMKRLNSFYIDGKIKT